MQTRFASLPRLLLGALFLALLPACATTRQPEVPGTLHVQVNVPPTWNPWLDDRISGAFTDRVRDVFHRAGFDRPVEEARLADDPEAKANLLTIQLLEWRINRIGNIDCTFAAELKTPRGTRNLGIYTQTEMRWLTGRGRFGLAQSFEDAAEGAIRGLCDDVAKTEWLPGLRRRAA